MKQVLLMIAVVALVGCGGDGTDGTMECDYCKEDIKRRALVCKHCDRENSYGIMRAESERESEMSDRQRVIYLSKKDNLEKYKSRKINKSEYEHGKAWWSPGGEGFQTLMDDPDYDSDGNLKKEEEEEPVEHWREKERRAKRWMWGIRIGTIAVIGLVGWVGWVGWVGEKKAAIEKEKAAIEKEKAAIEKEIRKAAKKPTGELTKTDLEKVTSLNLGVHPLTSVKGLEKLTQLRELNLWLKELTEVPKELEKLTQLRELKLRQYQRTSVTGLEKLTQLTWLDLSDNKLTDVKGLEKLTQLTKLDLNNNKLTDVSGLEKLNQLTKLGLFNNPDLTKVQIAELQKALPNCAIGCNPCKSGVPFGLSGEL